MSNKGDSSDLRWSEVEGGVAVFIDGHRFEVVARERLGQRDPDDWPILAAALALGCPIWTEDTDFFGCGVAIWTSRSVDMFLRECR